MKRAMATPEVLRLLRLRHRRFADSRQQRLILGRPKMGRESSQRLPTPLISPVVIDLFSRKIVGWNMSDNMKAQGIAETLQMALGRRKPQAGLVHHSDRGVQYACAMYRQLLEAHQIQCSMSRPGNCYDNAVAESFFGTLKSELLHRRHYRRRADAETSVFEWIECWYNRQRRHSSLGYLSPEVFEAQLN
jgi:transposase InsO family protein